MALKQIRSFFRDPEYYRGLLRLMLPIALQNLITSSLNFVSVVMIGQLGEVSIASVGLGNQVWFLLNLMVFGISSGSAMFSAQLWGKKDVHNIRRVVGLTVKLGLVAAAIFFILARFFPGAALRVYSNDPEVIATGSRYLRIVCWTYGFYALSAVFSMASRAVGNVRLPVAVSTSALIINVLIAYPLIFGVRFLGIPALGVEGAAIAGVIARVIECGALLFFIYRNRENPVAAGPRYLMELDWEFIKRVMVPVLPVIGNEILWSFGITTYNAIYGHIGTKAVAAINIISTVDQVAFVVFLGLGNATAVLVGNLIGQGRMEKAYLYAGRSLILQVLGAVVMGLLVILFAPLILGFYRVDPEVIVNARRLLWILGLGLGVRAANHMIVIGILRSGGDTRFSLVLDGLVIWLVGVPFTAAGAFLFHLPVYLVYALTLTEEITKASLGLKRYLSKKWINDLTGRVSEIIPE
ncbi:MAG TPA: MATE family efflux transporter [Anaerolineaceae bacterium]|nr:MATE family efflux transporter [Anaerolineaceae bacterium]HNS07970.1 MATE family efflux transporter [Anaerolineaceae bacterium]HOE03147.1 MATE family efflux transporter [Anaerolineaceae bacterium]HOQ68599.1 MATE family efflux transporter [Anaerolineaceae bacterium]HOS52969.1 MATE family efflux transporter [Anaerolineaceae bacterium]